MPKSRTAAAAIVRPPQGDTIAVELQPLSVTSAPLSQLRLSPRNPRAHLPAENVEALADNIVAYGLLSPMLVRDTPDGPEVIAGRRRLAALRRMVERDDLDAHAPVAVRFVPDEFADASALAENTHRVALDAASEARAWAAMIEGREGAPPLDVAEIARAFGATERFVRQRLRLAGLYPPILDALAAGAIPLDVAEAFAGCADRDRQADVWRALFAGGETPAWARTPHKVRDRLAERTLKPTAAVARFVGLDAYRAAGGRLSLDLFTAEREEEALWLDAALAERLAAERLSAAAEGVVAEGWGDVRHGFGAFDEHKLATDPKPPKPRKPTPEEAERLARLAAAAEAARTAHQQHRARDEDDWGGPDGVDYWDADDAFEEAVQAAEDALDRARADLIEYAPDAKARRCAYVTIAPDGSLAVERGLVPLAANAPVAGRGRAHEAANDAEPDAADASSDAAEPDAQAKAGDPFKLSSTAHQRLTYAAERTVAAAMANAAPNTPAGRAGLAALLAHIAGVFWFDRRVHGQGLFTFTPAPATLVRDTAADPLVAAVGARAASLKAALQPHAERLEAHLAEEASLDALLALANTLAAVMLCAREERALPFTEPRRAALRQLAGALGVAPAAVPFDEADARAMSVAGLRQAATDAGAPLAPGVKAKAAAVEAVALLAADRGWRPPLVRAFVGDGPPAAAESAPEPDAEPTPASRSAAAKSGKPARAKATKRTAEAGAAKPKPKARGEAKPKKAKPQAAAIVAADPEIF